MSAFNAFFAQITGGGAAANAIPAQASSNSNPAASSSTTDPRGSRGNPASDSTSAGSPVDSGKSAGFGGVAGGGIGGVVGSGIDLGVVGGARGVSEVYGYPLIGAVAAYPPKSASLESSRSFFGIPQVLVFCGVPFELTKEGLKGGRGLS